MSGRKLILGPPGTGKTEKCIRIVEGELAAGVEPSRIAYVTFGRAAAWEAKVRAEAACAVDGQFLWFRTIHSTAFKLGGLDPDQVMKPAHWAEFARKHGYRFTLTSTVNADESGIPQAPIHTPDDLVRALYDWGRNTRRTLNETLASSSLRIGHVELQKYGARFEAYKQSKGVVDYIDMIERSLNERPNVKVAVIDESQDLSPLQITAVEAWFAACERIYVAGDDDQSIYGFQGSDPGWLMGLAATPGFEVEVLRQSHRVPRAVHAFSQSIIRRNQHRVAKQYLPRDADGQVDHLPLESALRSIDMSRTGFVLVRNRCFANDVVTQLRRHDVPYASCIGGSSPMDPEHGVVRAVRSARAIGRGLPVTVGDLQSLLRRIPCRGFDLLPHGVKSALERRPKGSALTAVDVKQLIGSGTLLSALAVHGIAGVLRGEDAIEAKYVERVFTQYGEDIVPKLEVATIHSSKGRQADQVVLVPDQTRATYEEALDGRRGGREAETRVAYVAATRTSDRLVVVSPRTGRSYPYPRG